MARRNKVSLSNLLTIIGIASGIIAGVHNSGQLLTEWENGLVDWKAALAVFLLVAAFIAAFAKWTGKAHVIKLRRISPTLGILLLLALLSFAPSVYACTRDTFCPIIINGTPSVTGLRPKVDPQRGALDEFNLSLDSEKSSGDQPGINRNIRASAGETIRLYLCPSSQPTRFLYTQVTLQRDSKQVATFPPYHLSPGSCETVSYLIPEEVGVNPVEIEVYITFSLIGATTLLPASWKGSVSISTEDMVQAAPITIPEEVPTPIPHIPAARTQQSEPAIPPTPTPQPVAPTATEVSANLIGSACEPLEVEDIGGATDWPYVVAPDDSLPGLALFFYGDSGRWGEIYSANRAIIGTYSTAMPEIHTGQLINIPGVQSPLVHRVEAGDSLEALSRKMYGLGAECRWRTIYDANSDVIGTDPSRLNPGQLLRIFVRRRLKNDQLWVLPNESMTDIALGYYLDDRMRGWLCMMNGKGLSSDCDHLQPLETVLLPALPSVKQHIVLRGETWEQIAEKCYHDARIDLIQALQRGNRRIVGDDPTLLHEGQVLQLRGCQPG